MVGLGSLFQWLEFPKQCGKKEQCSARERVEQQSLQVRTCPSTTITILKDLFPYRACPILRSSRSGTLKAKSRTTCKVWTINKDKCLEILYSKIDPFQVKTNTELEDLELSREAYLTFKAKLQ